MIKFKNRNTSEFQFTIKIYRYDNNVRYIMQTFSNINSLPIIIKVVYPLNYIANSAQVDNENISMMSLQIKKYD
jgi:hypothetical protein